MATPIEKNTLFYGDNLAILREYIADESIDLIYLDPPFNSKRTYNVLFKNESGKESKAQIAAFDDTWHWDRVAEESYYELVTNAPVKVGKMIGSLRESIGDNQMMAYLVMMAIRLVELHRVLKSTGSLYLHCDPTASHYLKIVLDTIFGAENFRNEIIWKRQSAHSDAKTRFSDVADVILFYVRSKKAKFHPQYGEHDSEYIKKFYRFNDKDGRGIYSLADMTSPNPRPNMMYEWQGFPHPPKGWRFQRETMKKLHDEGRIYYPTCEDGTFNTKRRPRIKRYLNERKGSIITNIWSDIQPLHDVAAERLGYPTQKPVALLERIVQASSSRGEIVLDPFCGCGTTVAAAEKLERKWIGIDITHLAIALQKYRLQASFPDAEFEVKGEPETSGAARYLAEQDRFQFEWWALSLVKARPQKGTQGSKQGKKGADKGIDGVINFIDSAKGKPKQVLVQVKSGKVSSRDIRDLVGTVEREKGAIGVLVTLQSPTRAMKQEAVSARFYESKTWGRKYPKIQIFTIEELLAGTAIEMPPAWGTFKRAERVGKEKAIQEKLL